MRAFQEICSTGESDSRPTPRLTFDILFWLGGKRGAEVPECGKRGTWETRGLVENTWPGKHGVW